jgi:hypothetical protein
MAEQNPQIVQAQSIIESKLTKTEAIEIMVDDILRELRRAQKNAETEINKLKQVSVKEVAQYLKDADINYSSTRFDKDGGFNIHVTYATVKESVLFKDPVIGERMRRLKEISVEHSNIQDQIHKLTQDKTSTKVALLKSILEGSPEGRDWLAQLDTIRHRAAKRFNISVNPRLLAGKL